MSSAALRDTLTNFFLAHNPSKVDNVDTLVVKYTGNEEEVYLLLEG